MTRQLSQRRHVPLKPLKKSLKFLQHLSTDVQNY